MLNCQFDFLSSHCVIISVIHWDVEKFTQQVISVVQQHKKTGFSPTLQILLVNTFTSHVVICQE